jgi:hypothetical protein
LCRHFGESRIGVQQVFDLAGDGLTEIGNIGRARHLLLRRLSPDEAGAGEAEQNENQSTFHAAVLGDNPLIMRIGHKISPSLQEM